MTSTASCRQGKRQYFSIIQSKSSPCCLCCGRTSCSLRRDRPVANDTCHRCGKRGHWQQVCRAFNANTVFQAHLGCQPGDIITHEEGQVRSEPIGIFVDLDLSTNFLVRIKHSIPNRP